MCEQLRPTHLPLECLLWLDDGTVVYLVVLIDKLSEVSAMAVVAAVGKVWQASSGVTIQRIDLHGSVIGYDADGVVHIWLAIVKRCHKGGHIV